jgi:hypothetical protein
VAALCSCFCGRTPATQREGRILIAEPLQRVQTSDSGRKEAESSSGTAERDSPLHEGCATAMLTHHRNQIPPRLAQRVVNGAKSAARQDEGERAITAMTRNRSSLKSTLDREIIVVSSSPAITTPAKDDGEDDVALMRFASIAKIPSHICFALFAKKATTFLISL